MAPTLTVIFVIAFFAIFFVLHLAGSFNRTGVRIRDIAASLIVAAIVTLVSGVVINSFTGLISAL